MSMRSVLGILIVLFLASCSSPPPKRTLSIIEQIAEDNQSVKDLQLQFEKKIDYVSLPEVEKYLSTMARRLLQNQEGLTNPVVRVRVYHDNKNANHWYSFPGTLIVVPRSVLEKVEYENELAAGLAFELANVFNRHLAHKVENKTSFHVLFGEGSVFELDRSERAESIDRGTKYLYYAGYDLRGMASVFQRYPEFFGGLSSKKEVDFNVKESQRVRSGYLPARDPVVKSPEFVRFKKWLKKT